MTPKLCPPKKNGKDYTPQVQHGILKWSFPKGLSFSRVAFSGSILNFGKVNEQLKPLKMGWACCPKWKASSPKHQFSNQMMGRETFRRSWLVELYPFATLGQDDILKLESSTWRLSKIWHNIHVQEITPWTFNSSPTDKPPSQQGNSCSKDHFSGAILNFWGVLYWWFFLLFIFFWYTPDNQRLEPKNHTSEKEHIIHSPPFLGFKMIIFQGVLDQKPPKKTSCAV